MLLNTWDTINFFSFHLTLWVLWKKNVSYLFRRRICNLKEKAIIFATKGVYSTLLRLASIENHSIAHLCFQMDLFFHFSTFDSISMSFRIQRQASKIEGGETSLKKDFKCFAVATRTPQEKLFFLIRCDVHEIDFKLHFNLFIYIVIVISPFFFEKSSSYSTLQAVGQGCSKFFILFYFLTSNIFSGVIMFERLKGAEGWRKHIRTGEWKTS